MDGEGLANQSHGMRKGIWKCVQTNRKEPFVQNVYYINYSLPSHTTILFIYYQLIVFEQHVCPMGHLRLFTTYRILENKITV
jgi:hypothetical protein